MWVSSPAGSTGLPSAEKVAVRAPSLPSGRLSRPKLTIFGWASRISRSAWAGLNLSSAPAKTTVASPGSASRRLTALSFDAGRSRPSVTSLSAKARLSAWAELGFSGGDAPLAFGDFGFARGEGRIGGRIVLGHGGVLFSRGGNGFHGRREGRARRVLLGLDLAQPFDAPRRKGLLGLLEAELLR